MGRKSDLTLLEALVAWPADHAAQLARAGATATSSYGPADLPKRSAWLDLVTPTNLGELIVWDSGEAELMTAQKDPDGPPGVAEHLELRTAHDLEQALRRLMLAAGVVRSARELDRAALDFVLTYETRQGRAAVLAPMSAGVDVISPPRSIQVKATAQDAREGTLTIALTANEVRRARSESSSYVYVVHNVAQGDPDLFQLRIVSADELHGLAGTLEGRPMMEFSVPAQPLVAA